MTGPDQPELEQRLTDYLTRSDAALLRGEDAFRRRQGREAIRELFLACFLAACALNLASGFDPGREISPGALAKDPHGVFAGPATRSLGRFYHRLHQYKHRLDNDQKTYVNIEEVANWLRGATTCVAAMKEMVRGEVGG